MKVTDIVTTTVSSSDNEEENSNTTASELIKKVEPVTLVYFEGTQQSQPNRAMTHSLILRLNQRLNYLGKLSKDPSGALSLLF